ncbi:MAG TPA: hypothetical protein EYO58_11925 [Flavobacteriales bacterium]|nr:hypothetical protein [Flavobacteriales bacterium]
MLIFLCDDDDYDLFTDEEGIIHLGVGLSKDMPLSKSLSLPVNTSLIINPDAGNVILTSGVTLE